MNNIKFVNNIKFTKNIKFIDIFRFFLFDFLQIKISFENKDLRIFFNYTFNLIVLSVVKSFFSFYKLSEITRQNVLSLGDFD